ncbi:MAG: polyprenyl synthetase family protein [Proteobacteria bacterium]|nr:polyprenyl synthetase family protein [Pseudomonadota bacterium]
MNEPTTAPVVLQPLAAASRRAGLGELADRLLAMRDWVGDELIALERTLLELGGDDVAWSAARHLLHQPGKRIRPLCTLLASRLGSPSDGVVGVALAGELVHTATLLHDDVIDLGELRRGAPASRMVYGNSASVLAGDHLLVQALKAARKGPPAVCDELIDVIGKMVTAEAVQLNRRGVFDADADHYWGVIDGKTAALFEWALRAGGHLGGLNAEQVDALGTAGVHLGICFQLVDDAIDFSASDDLGKLPFADLREGKSTYPLLIASERDPSLLPRIQAVANGDEITDDLLAAIAATDALSATRDRAAQAADRAREALRTLPEGRARLGLIDLVNGAERRTR